MVDDNNKPSEVKPSNSSDTDELPKIDPSLISYEERKLPEGEKEKRSE